MEPNCRETRAWQVELEAALQGEDFVLPNDDGPCAAAEAQADAAGAGAKRRKTEA